MHRLKLTALCLLVCLLTNAQSYREKLLLNQDWRFAKGHAANPEKDFNYGRALSFSKIAFLQESTLLNADQESRMRIPHTQNFNDEKWDSISLPHDWGMAAEYGKEEFKVKGYRKLGGRSPENSVGWYRKKFKPSLKKGCRYSLEFEGIFRDAQVWMNGIYLGRNESGYVPAVFDITECLNYQEGADNVITVRVDATHSELWSYEGAGIYRNVWLHQTAPVHIPQWGTFVTSEVDLTAKTANINARIEVTNQNSTRADVTIINIVRDNKGTEIGKTETSVRVDPLETEIGETTMTVTNPNLWSLKSPHMYTLYTELFANGEKIDSYETPFGIRSIRFDANEGFFLNGEHVPIQGVCCHQDHAGVGIGVPDRVNEWRIAKLKEFGVNAYRASHNPPTTAILNACDTLGILVMDEMRVLSSSDEGLKQMETIIRRDRNHPSVIIWCLGNEEPAIQGNDKGRMIIERMKAIQHKMDPTRLCTAAMNGSWGEGFTHAVDVQGSNYFKIGNIDEVHAKFPELPCLFTEEASTVMTRGIYHTDAEKGFHQAYDRDFPGWGSSAQEWLRYVDARKFVAGAFIWTGFDYGGESVMHYWPGVVSHFGIMDYCGFPKDVYWYYKSWWTEEPVIHILPHWNGIGTDSVDVHVYTNMDEIELRVNGKSVGKKQLNKFDIPSWRVKYVPGKLEVKGKKNGKLYNQTLATTGKASSLKLNSETGTQLKGDGNDVAIITLKVLDNKGRLVPTAENNIQFKIHNGKLLGIGNGHPSSHERDIFNPGEEIHRNAFGGYVQLIVSSDRSGNPIEIEAYADELKNDKLTLSIKE